MNLRTRPGRSIVAVIAMMTVLSLTALGQPLVARPVMVAPAAGATAGKPAGPTGLHIPQTKRASFTYTVNDGAGFSWNIQYYGSIQSGTNYAYSGGLYCQINGSNVTGNGVGWVNKAGDEIEIGPYSRSNLNIYRRVKIYKDQGLARWLDIFENPTSAPITVPVAIYTNTNYSIQKTTTSSGAATFGEKDWAFTTKTSGGNSPQVLHMVCDKRSKLRPQVQTSSSQIYVRWNVIVPAKQTVVLCYFESQANSPDAHTKMMKSFRVSTVLRDLPSSVRQLIVNWSVGGFAGIDLERAEQADTVMIAGENGPKFGRITNESFTLQTYFGPLTLPASKIVGMVAGTEETQTVRFALLDGQIVSAAMPDEKVVLELPTGGKLQIPLSRISQWSFRVTPDRPLDSAFAGPYAMLRTGDRLAFEADSVDLSFRTRHGKITLDPRAMLSVTLDNEANVVHQARFLNGSHLGGFLEPRKITMKLQLGASLTVPRDMIAQLRFAEEERPNAGLAFVAMTNEDELFGRLGSETFDVASEFGTVPVKPANIRAISFSATTVGYAVLTLWDGTVLRGRIGSKPVAFHITPGPTLRINPVQFVSIICPEALPPDDIVAKARKLIALLGSESYADRKRATEELIKLGAGIAPILQRRLGQATDPEVSQRIEDILQRIGAPATPKPPAAPAGHNHDHAGAIRLFAAAGAQRAVW